MHGPLSAPEPHPERLLDDYVESVNRCAHGSLAATALRTGSVSARHLLARAVGPATLDELLAVARGDQRGDASLIQSKPSPLTDLARVVALQNLSPSDRSDSLALFDLAVEHFGPEQIPPARQGQHAQIAYYLGHWSRAAALCDQYKRIPRLVRQALEIDLANPFAGPADTDEAGWLSRFQEYFPPPYPSLESSTDGPPFDRVRAPVAERVVAPETISVIVTSFCPSGGLVTAVRSLLDQTWSNLEVLIVDDGSPIEYEPVLKQCLGLDDRVRLVRLAVNGGTYRARNAGLDVASGSFIAFQDSDDWSHPVRLEHQVRPLLADQTLVATTSDGLRASPELTITVPGRASLTEIASSLMIRKDRVLRHVGYFDSVRKASDSEYQSRIQATFGDRAVHHLSGTAYSLIRISPTSLSGQDIRARWLHPARAAYRSAYGLWHQQIHEGSAGPHLPKEPARRPFAAPAYISVTAAPISKPAYDVVYAGDWRWYGEVQRSVVAEIRVLARHGMRVGVIQMEAFRFTTLLRAPLCRPIQELINDGTVENVVLPDVVDVGLLIVRQPSVLQFPPGAPSNVRASRVVLTGDEAPSALDGTDQRYAPQACTDVAQRMFAAAPFWCPQGPAVREVLVRELAATDLASFDLPSVIDPQEWRFHRTGFRSGRPVLGRESTGWPTTWPADHRTLVEAYPDSLDFDVRVWGDVEAPRQLVEAPRQLVNGRIPPNWLVYAPDEVSVRSFLHQIDFYVYFPHPQRAEAFEYAILEALAAGCVVILPDRFSGTFGDAAVYCAASEVRDVVGSYYADVERFLDQGRRAAGWVQACFGGDAYFDRVRSLITPEAQKPGEGH